MTEMKKNITQGALKFSQKKVREIMTPRTAAVGVLKSEKISKKLIDRLLESGMSRFPVYEDERREEIIGIIHIRQFVGKIPRSKISNLEMLEAKIVEDKTTLDIVLNKFIDTCIHMFIIQNEFGEFVGIVTMEDILEEILQREIIDENDRHYDMRRFALARKNQSKNLAQLFL